MIMITKNKMIMMNRNLMKMIMIYEDDSAEHIQDEEKNDEQNDALMMNRN